MDSETEISLANAKESFNAEEFNQTINITKQLLQAPAVCDEAILLDLQGASMFKLKLFKASAKKYEAAIELCRHNYDYHNNRALALFQSDRLEQAKELLEEAIEHVLDPAYFWNLSRVAEKLNNKDLVKKSVGCIFQNQHCNHAYMTHDGLVLSFLKKDFETIPYAYRLLEQIDCSFRQALGIIRSQETDREGELLELMFDSSSRGQPGKKLSVVKMIRQLNTLETSLRILVPKKIAFLKRILVKYEIGMDQVRMLSSSLNDSCKKAFIDKFIDALGRIISQIIQLKDNLQENEDKHIFESYMGMIRSIHEEISQGDVANRAVDFELKSRYEQYESAVKCLIGQEVCLWELKIISDQLDCTICHPTISGEYSNRVIAFVNPSFKLKMTMAPLTEDPKSHIINSTYNTLIWMIRLYGMYQGDAKGNGGIDYKKLGEQKTISFEGMVEILSPIIQQLSGSKKQVKLCLETSRIIADIYTALGLKVGEKMKGIENAVRALEKDFTEIKKVFAEIIEKEQHSTILETLNSADTLGDNHRKMRQYLFQQQKEEESNPTLNESEKSVVQNVSILLISAQKSVEDKGVKYNGYLLIEKILADSFDEANQESSGKQFIASKLNRKVRLSKANFVDKMWISLKEWI